MVLGGTGGAGGSGGAGVRRVMMTLRMSLR